MPTQTGSQAEMVIAMPIWLQLFVALSAGFTEETLFRGMLLESLRPRGQAVALGVSAAAFAA